MKLPQFPLTPLLLSDETGLPARHHAFTREEFAAIHAALGARRPLLIRGEPGVGKTQLAQAVAKVCNAPLISVVVDSRTESRDLLYSYDAVRRLSEAQLAASTPPTQDAANQQRKRLQAKRFLSPGPAWWAFNWESAETQAKRSQAPLLPRPEEWRPGDRTVLLIDEIDKAETDVPNGLLEALGSWSFPVPHFREPVRLQGEPPLVIITTNEERALPDPFLRRCAVLTLKLPGQFSEEGTNVTLRRWLVQRAKDHFGSSGSTDAVYELAADQLLRDRWEAIQNGWSPKPGQAEYLDLIRALITLDPGNADAQMKRLETISPYLLQKHGEEIE